MKWELLGFWVVFLLAAFGIAKLAGELGKAVARREAARDVQRVKEMLQREEMQHVQKLHGPSPFTPGGGYE